VFLGSWYTSATLLWSVACCASSSAPTRVSPLSRLLLSKGCGPVSCAASASCVTSCSGVASCSCVTLSSPLSCHVIFNATIVSKCGPRFDPKYCCASSSSPPPPPCPSPPPGPNLRLSYSCFFQQFESFVEMCTVRCCPLWHPVHFPMGTVPQVLVRRTASPAHADFGGLSSGAAHVVVRLDVVYFPLRSSAPTVAGCRVGGYPAGRDRWGGKSAAGGMSEDNDRCFSTLVLGAFSTGVSNTICITPHSSSH